MSVWSRLPCPSLDAFADLAQACWLRLPEAFRKAAGEVVFRIEDLADEETLEALDIEDPFALTGLYQGLDLTRRSMLDPEPFPAMVTLYRRALLDEWAEAGDLALEDLVLHVIVHEIGHHFGFSDAAMDAILEEAAREAGE